MSIIIAQGLPESPHHVLGNLWIKIAGWLKRSDLSKHKQSDWQIWWIGCGWLVVLGQLRGLAVSSSERHFGVLFCLFFLLQWMRENRLPSIALSLSATCVVHIAVFSLMQQLFAVRAIVACVGIGLPSSKWLTEGGLWLAVVLLLPPPCRAVVATGAGLLGSDRCLDKR